MKNLLHSFLLVLATSVLVSAQNEIMNPEKGSIIKFDEKSFNFGDINQGDVVEHVFAFQNTGSKPLVLSEVKTTCGCTAPTWPKDPVLPGEKGEILIRFNSSGKSGIQNKIVTIHSNAQNSPEKVTIVSNVKKDTDS